jgi:hypothetical protein
VEKRRVDVRCSLAMTSTNDEANALRTDTRGRVRTPIERREELLDEFERSGISAMAFAKMAGVNYATFANWRQKRRKAGGPRTGLPENAAANGATVEANRPVRLFEAFVERGSSAGARSAGLTVELPAGARLVVESPGQLRLAAELLVLLEQNTRRSC